MPNYSYYGEKEVHEQMDYLKRDIRRYTNHIEGQKLRILDILTSPDAISIVDTDELSKCVVTIERIQTKRYEAEKMLNILHSIRISQEVDRDENLKRDVKVIAFPA